MTNSEASADSRLQNQAWICSEFGDYQNLELKHISVENPGKDQLVIQNQVVSLGFPDLLMVQGKYQLKPSLPFIPGTEFCGRVLQVGSKSSKFPIGSTVIGSVRYGASAKYLIASESDCMSLPSRLSIEEGAAFLVAYKTAYVGLIMRGKLKAGEKVLVLGASGGVGLAAVNLAKSLGARVYAAVSSESKRESVLRKGADYVFDVSRDDLRACLKKLTQGVGVDVVFDPVGGNLFDTALRCLAPLGRMLVIGFASGEIPKLSVNYALIKQLSIIGVRAGEFGRVNLKDGERVMKELASLVQQEGIKPEVYNRLDWTALKQAFMLIENREVVGRATVLCM